MHLSPLRHSITSITTDSWQKICIVTKQNALFKEILNFLIDLRSAQINLHKGVSDKGPKKKFIQERASLDGDHEEAEIQRKVLKPAKNLAFSEDTCLQKKRVQSKVIPRKVGVGLKRRRELNERRLGWRLDWWGFAEKEASHFLELRGRHRYSDQSSNQNKQRPKL